MKVQISFEAENDLEEISDFIAKDNPKRARSFARELTQSCRDIGRTPRGYQVAYRYPDGDLRRKVHGKYLIFYRIHARHISIARILHSARNVKRILGFSQTP